MFSIDPIFSAASSTSPKECQYSNHSNIAHSEDTNQSENNQSDDSLTFAQKAEILTFCSGNPDLSVDVIRENYTEKFKKIITSDMLSKIMKLGKSCFSYGFFWSYFGNLPKNNSQTLMKRKPYQFSCS